jgi:CheY-like chemotaxis protein
MVLNLSERDAQTMPNTSVTECSILVVEDDADLRNTLAVVLEEEGFHVATAGNGKAAMEVLRRGFHADLILLDLMMPEMNGWEFRALQRAESDPAIASVPVVVVSAFGRQLDTTSLDAVAYLNKPLGLAELGSLRSLAVGARQTRSAPGDAT